MTKWQAAIDGTAAFFGALFGFFFGEAGGLLYVLTAFMVMDYITGLIAAGIAHRISSEIGFKGLAKKLLILAFVSMGHILDSFVLSGTPAVMSAVMLFYIANEGISIIENAAQLGMPIPKKLKMLLEQLKDSDEKEDKNDE